MLKIRMHKADNGDCVSIETDCDFILIDGGTAQSFDEWKEQVIGRIDKIDSIIVTHIDNDHINGMIKLLTHPDCPSVEQVYFNGAEQLFGQLDEYAQEDRRTELKLLALSEECSIINNKEHIGYSEGTSLSYVLSSKRIKCNAVVSGGALYREICDSFEIGALKFTLISPVKNSLSELKRIWEDKLKERNVNPRIISKPYYDAFEQYTSNLKESISNNHQITAIKQSSIEALANTAFDDDDSPTNRSSFSFLIESDGKRILYLGDCNAEAVTSWLDQYGQEKIKVDIVKISHHGSKNNTSLALLRRLDSPKYLVSTNGNSHGHPDLETLARIVLVNSGSETEILLNYELETIPSWFVAELTANYPSIKLLMNSCEVVL
ncbi:MBL fold hydrolase [Pragia fontium]|uniref:MBL fold hydrolase n=1 Tax=Pragia fontium TaxID=82985 RepID=A0ABQ5LHE5_9GAMM|nr:MBL fold metallo-hydrolase [Pragia fontium]GKX62804.1 MBL fold hydrolase [Pragia fontium]